MLEIEKIQPDRSLNVDSRRNCDRNAAFKIELAIDGYFECLFYEKFFLYVVVS